MEQTIIPHDESDILSKMKELIKIIKYHNDLYYNQQSPEIEDTEYDKLFAELKKLEELYPKYIQSDSPTQKLISQSGSEIFKKSKHLYSMLSLDNTYDENDLKEFEQRVRNLIKYNEEIEYIVELKFDGVSIELIYENQILKTAITRGDGEIGEDVTNNIKTIKSIPHKIFTSEILSIRGEIVMPKSSFLQLNNYLDEIGENTFANTRNAASGSIRQKDPTITSSRNLDMFVYTVISPIHTIKTHKDSLDFAKQNGLNLYNKIKLCKNIDEVIAYTNEIEKIKNTFDFEIDGLVIKVNNIALQQRIGETAHHPRWAIAYKFKAETKLTLLKGVEYTVGRTGNIGIVGLLEPINLSGAKISRVSLHNFDLISQKDIQIGDTVEVKRAGEVIPEVIGSIKEHRQQNTNKILPPTHCPSCGHEVVKLDETQVAYYCININCPAQIKEKLIHFVSKDAMNISGLGISIIDLFFEKHLITKITDIYELYKHREEIIALEGFKDKKIDNIINAIETSKQNDLYKLIYGLGIRHVGEKMAKILAKNFHTMENLIKVTYEELLNIDEIGTKVADSFIKYIKENIPLIEELKNIGLNMTSNLKQDTISKLSGQNFLFTGELSNIGRREAKSLVEKHGGTVLSSISKNLDFLVVGSNPGSKLKKAQELGIKIIDEKEFEKLL